MILEICSPLLILYKLNQFISYSNIDDFWSKEKFAGLWYEKSKIYCAVKRLILNLTKIY